MHHSRFIKIGYKTNYFTETSAKHIDFQDRVTNLCYAKIYISLKCDWLVEDESNAQINHPFLKKPKMFVNMN